MKWNKIKRIKPILQPAREHYWGGNQNSSVLTHFSPLNLPKHQPLSPHSEQRNLWYEQILKWEKFTHETADLVHLNVSKSDILSLSGVLSKKELQTLLEKEEEHLHVPYYYTKFILKNILKKKEAIISLKLLSQLF